MNLEYPLFKIFQRPLISVAGSWVDAFPLMLLFVFLFLAALSLWRFERRQLARRLIQLASAFVFILLIHRCLCVIRGWAFGIQEIGRDDLFAFAQLCMFVPIVAFTLSLGRIFCGWVCPLGFLQELTGKIGTVKNKLEDLRRKKLFDYVFLSITAGCILVLFFIIRPSTDFLTENVAALWGFGLLIILFFAVTRHNWALGLRRLKWVSLFLWVSLAVIGVFLTNPWCVLFGNELDYSSLLALFAVMGTSVVMTLAWCRYLCPLGALLAWVSKFSMVRIRGLHKCNDCGRDCEKVCPTGVLSMEGIDHSSCIFCGRCFDTCGARLSIPDEIEAKPVTARETADFSDSKELNRKGISLESYKNGSE